jgi:hypothetical protein
MVEDATRTGRLQVKVYTALTMDDTVLRRPMGTTVCTVDVADDALANLTHN